MSKKVRIVQRVRIVALVGGQNNFSFGMPGDCIWADCIDCNMSIIGYFNSISEAKNTTDEEITKIFESHGWSIRPTLCPDCK